MREIDGFIKVDKRDVFSQGNELKQEAEFLKDLDEEQLKPVIDLYGPKLVLAGAGSGKTRVIVYRVANMIHNGIKPSEILMMTFTNKAAREMKDRIGSLIGDKVNGVTCGTYHHVGNLILRKYAEKVGLKSNYTILDEDDVRSLLKLARVNVAGKNKLIPKEKVLKEIISLSINKNGTVKSIINSQFREHGELADTITDIAREYIRLKIKNNVVDYDDILLYWKIIMQKNEDIRRVLSNKYRYLLIDEYQDTNLLQLDIVKLMVGKEKNIMVVGDGNQSIYSWRGAEIDNILNFEKTFEGSIIYPVSFNYRSVGNIVRLANESIKNNRKRLDLELKALKDAGKTPEIYKFPDSESEAEYIVQEIKELVHEGLELKDIAVLYRNHYFAKDLEIELTKNNIPYDLRSGVKFFEKRHIKDVISFLRIIFNSDDEVSWIRLLGQLEGIGAKTISVILENILNNDDVLGYINNEKEFKFVKRGKESFLGFVKLLKEVNGIKNIQEIMSVFLESHYRKFLELNFENYVDRIEDIKSLIDYSYKYDTLERFLEDVSLLEEIYGKDDVDEDSRDRDKLVLSTIHRSKGLEWKVVFIIGCNEGRFPSSRGEYDNDYLEEERRLFYVSLTRAESELYISYVSTMYSYEKNSRILTNPSLFLLELPENLYKHYTLEE